MMFLGFSNSLVSWFFYFYLYFFLVLYVSFWSDMLVRTDRGALLCFFCFVVKPHSIIQ
ncbi:uncharacterized protein BP01DRAFT_120628 [Aspergillus saccharolyticus JOP 1030-1]|uniref:Uncharacterized protein n=1 Tax=Aspergillus saccharolyticus JOP 1030-1 TaxID=1450539 RepID=A0A318ZN94_9EURO|nr:hypothetical protein BP01DRAFT_120628 [Aspergillus saccharolyticus JOP 1030-1]PYH49081.1 hypothetical protein BP01DRAFT_120628 [Aspergillus saccharolyticus JOP 1030-1]